VRKALILNYIHAENICLQKAKVNRYVYNKIYTQLAVLIVI